MVRLLVKLSVALMASTLIAQAWAAQISVRADRNPVALNESFRLIYESEQDPDDDPDFTPLEAVVDILNRGQSSNISIINGEYSSRKTWTLTVMAKRSGDLQIPPIAFGSDLSQGLSISVTQADNQAGQLNEFFVRVRVDSKQLYVQQQLIVTRQLFSAYNLSGYAFGELVFNGMETLVEPLGKESQYRTRIGDQGFQVIEQKFAVFPQQSGTLIIEPILAEGQTGAQGNSLFDRFNSRGRVVRTRSEAIELKVLPVPANADMNPWLPARNLSITEQWSADPLLFKPGEPLTRTLSIKADGLTAAQLPEIARVAIGDVKQYPDQPLLKDVRNPNGISGFRVEKTAYLVSAGSQVQIPGIEIPWWDVASNSRQVARIAPRVIDVLAPAPDAPTVASAEPADKITTVDSTPQPAQPQPAAIPPAGAQVQSYWMWLAVIGLLGWLATIVTWWLQSNRSALDPEGLTQTPVPTVKQTLSKLKQACRAGKPEVCREALLDCARLMSGKRERVGLAPIFELASPELNSQIKALDAALYGRADQAIQFDLIEAEVRQLLLAAQSQSTPTHNALEPLYKSTMPR